MNGTVVRATAIWAGIITGALLRVRAFGAGRSLWWDEALLGQNLRGRTLVALLIEPMEFGQSAPPGYLILGRSAAVLLGGSDAALRSVSLLAGLAVLGLTAALARTSIRSAPLAVALVWSVALSPTLIYYASELKQYSSDAFAVLLTLYLWRIRRQSGWTTQALGGALAAILSLPGLIALAAMAAARVTEAAWDDAADRGRLRGFIERTPSAVRRLGRLLVVWGVAAALHLAHGLTVGGDRSSMLDWWRFKGGFPPELPWDRADLSWFTSSFSRLVWLSTGHEGRAYPGMDRGPVALMLGVGALVLLGLALGRRRPGWGLLPLTALIGSATLMAAVLRIYPFSSRLLVFLVPPLLLAVFVAADSVLHGRWARVLAAGVIAPMLGAQMLVTVPRAVVPLDDRDVLEALDLIGDGPPGAQLLTYEPPLLDWYRSRIPPTVAQILGEPSLLEGAIAAVEAGRSPALWVVSTHEFELAAADVESAGPERFSCIRTSRETFVAVVLAADIAEDVACASSSGR